MYIIVYINIVHLNYALVGQTKNVPKSALFLRFLTVWASLQRRETSIPQERNWRSGDFQWFAQLSHWYIYLHLQYIWLNLW